MITVHPKLMVQRMVNGQPVEMRLTSIDIDANENMYGEPLHEVHGSDMWGLGGFWFETTDSLKTLLDVATDNVFIPQDDTEANVRVALGH